YVMRVLGDAGNDPVKAAQLLRAQYAISATRWSLAESLVELERLAGSDGGGAATTRSAPPSPPKIPPTHKQPLSSNRIISISESQESQDSQGFQDFSGRNRVAASRPAPKTKKEKKPSQTETAISAAQSLAAEIISGE